MRTTIELSDELLTKAKSRAAASGISLRTFFTEAVERKLEERKL
jgi:predicted DNA binding CopG/RHH family protein